MENIKLFDLRPGIWTKEFRIMIHLSYDQSSTHPLSHLYPYVPTYSKPCVASPLTLLSSDLSIHTYSSLT